MPSNKSCDYLVSHGAELEADPDIAGIGVVVAFLLTAYITFFFIFGAYILGYIDAELLRPIDTIVHRRNSKRSHGLGYKTLRKCILAFSDQQIVTGIAIMIAGFVGLVNNNTSVYHFQIVIYLAWMSSSVHLSAVTVLSSFLKSHRAVMEWRIFGMLTLFLLLLVGLVPTSSNKWAVRNTGPDMSLPEIGSSTTNPPTGWGVPAHCYFHELRGANFNGGAPVSYALFLISYLWKIGGLFKTPRSIYRRYIRGPPEYLLERILHRQASTKQAKGKKHLGFRYHVAMVCYVWWVILNEALSSFAASLYLSAIGLVFGTIKIIVPREQNWNWIGDEQQWGFGQIVPLVLLIQPLGGLLEDIRTRKKQRSRSNSVRESVEDGESEDSEESENSDTDGEHGDSIELVELAPSSVGGEKQGPKEALTTTLEVFPRSKTANTQESVESLALVPSGKSDEEEQRQRHKVSALTAASTSGADIAQESADADESVKLMALHPDAVVNQQPMYRDALSTATSSASNKKRTTAAWTSFLAKDNKNKRPSPPTGRTLSSLFAENKPLQPSQRTSKVAEHQSAMFESWTFRCLIVMVELNVIAFCVLAFGTNVGTMGDPEKSWHSDVLGFGVIIIMGDCWLLLLLGLPFSRLSR